MTNSLDGPDNEKTPTDAASDLEKYKIRYGFYKIIVGTALVGALGVIVPGAIQAWDLYFADKRKQLEVQLETTRSQQAYIKEFLTTALNQDIELRLRFADYFREVSPIQYKQDWESYYLRLSEIREKTRLEIGTKERNLQNLISLESKTIQEQIEISQLEYLNLKDI